MTWRLTLRCFSEKGIKRGSRMQINQTYYNQFGDSARGFIEDQILGGTYSIKPILIYKVVDSRNDLCSSMSGLDPTTDYG